jgi:hypothetical protein
MPLVCDSGKLAKKSVLLITLDLCVRWYSTGASFSLSPITMSRPPELSFSGYDVRFVCAGHSTGTSTSFPRS